MFLNIPGRVNIFFTKNMHILYNCVMSAIPLQGLVMGRKTGPGPAGQLDSAVGSEGL